jgi:hypothetical protein
LKRRCAFAVIEFLFGYLAKIYYKKIYIPSLGKRRGGGKNGGGGGKAGKKYAESSESEDERQRRRKKDKERKSSSKKGGGRNSESEENSDIDEAIAAYYAVRIDKNQVDNITGCCP